jgi:hypothetical protein
LSPIFFSASLSFLILSCAFTASSSSFSTINHSFGCALLIWRLAWAAFEDSLKAMQQWNLLSLTIQ